MMILTVIQLTVMTMTAMIRLMTQTTAIQIIRTALTVMITIQVMIPRVTKQKILQMMRPAMMQEMAPKLRMLMKTAIMPMKILLKISLVLRGHLYGCHLHQAKEQLSLTVHP